MKSSLLNFQYLCKHEDRRNENGQDFYSLLSMQKHSTLYPSLLGGAHKVIAINIFDFANFRAKRNLSQVIKSKPLFGLHGPIPKPKN